MPNITDITELVNSLHDLIQQTADLRVEVLAQEQERSREQDRLRAGLAAAETRAEWMQGEVRRLQYEHRVKRYQQASRLVQEFSNEVDFGGLVEQVRLTPDGQAAADLLLAVRRGMPMNAFIEIGAGGWLERNQTNADEC